MGRFIMLSGPSCVGKGPLVAALRKFYPELAGNLKQLVLYNSRSPRPGETDGVDYHFRSRTEMETLRSREGFIVLDVRGDLQGIDVTSLRSSLDEGNDILFEGNPFVPEAIWQLADFPVPALSVFLSPLAKEEIRWLKSQKVNLTELVTDVMRRKLLRRTTCQKGILSLPDLENIEKRAKSAPVELGLAWRFDWVIPNHDGEDSENWNAFYYPIGDARRTLTALASILEGNVSQAGVEKWDENLWPQY